MSTNNSYSSASNPTHTIGFALKLAQQTLRNHMDTALHQIGLSTPKYAVLARLQLAPGASNAELARAVFVTPQTMQAILVGLEKEGLVTRTPHPQHGRIQTTELTPAGCTALTKAADLVADAENRLRAAAEPLSPESVIELLKRLSQSLRE
ncbi:MarR family winged helix-turn-helix transcriptional regulator [Shewanella sp. A3A]|nr:MarR family winged helix-turn-helix transcriptional regulator [Shewanella ferrihydritica]